MAEATGQVPGLTVLEAAARAAADLVVGLAVDLVVVLAVDLVAVVLVGPLVAESDGG